MAMALSSTPRNPGAIALLGDFALQQNASDRSQPELNEKADTILGPAHALWKSLWNTQQQLENALQEKTLLRDERDDQLDKQLVRIKSALEIALGKNNPAIKQYLPDGKTAINQQPLQKAITVLDTYRSTINDAPDSLISSDLKAAFASAYDAAKTAQAVHDSASKSLVEAQVARASGDASWLEAYRAYHRAVEYVCEGDRTLIKQWIMEWPQP